MTNDKLSEVFNYLRPKGGWAFSGVDWENAYYDEGVEPITKVELEKTLDEYEVWKLRIENNKIAARQGILDRLGITEEEAKILLG